MSELQKMMNRWARVGTVDWIGLRAARRVAMQGVPRADVTFNGLDGDRSRAGKRAVTLIQAEHLPVIGAFLGRDAVLPDALRRNIVVSGLNLGSLKGRQILVGTAVLRLTVICAPCSRMEETFGHGGYSAVRGHGGWCAEVISAGVIRLGDEVRPLDAEAKT